MCLPSKPNSGLSYSIWPILAYFPQAFFCMDACPAGSLSCGSTEHSSSTKTFSTRQTPSLFFSFSLFPPQKKIWVATPRLGTDSSAIGATMIKKFSKSGCIYWLFPIHLRSDPINMIVSNTFKISNNHSCCSDVMWAATDIHWYYWDAPHLIVLYRTVRYSTVQECTVLYITTEYSKCRTNEHCTKQQIYNGTFMSLCLIQYQ